MRVHKAQDINAVRLLKQSRALFLQSTALSARALPNGASAQIACSIEQNIPVMQAPIMGAEEALLIRHARSEHVLSATSQETGQDAAMVHSHESHTSAMLIQDMTARDMTRRQNA